ncbi:MAG TPA: FAD-dependent oxidoreductase [Pseudomonadales bacterium]|nr:FAD-dependent oxidoreductase [Pseudomonadales bacterium]
MSVGAAGGSAAMFRVGAALGWVPAFAAAERPTLRPVAGKRTVVILGAGVSGLVAAYELGRAGYRCTILEASHRAGGRNLTLRRGDKVDELGHPQVCPFDDDPDLYLNAGPARIPSVHERLLEYCRELNVQLSPFVNDNHNAWVQDDAMFDGKPVRNREYVTDARGFMAELLAKGIQSHRIDAELDALDVERLLGFLRAYGDLDEAYLYHGSSRAGYRNAAMIEAPQLKGVLDIRELLKSSFWRSNMHFAEGQDQSPMMMEPVGGMDKVVDALMAKVGKTVQLNAQVESVMLRDGGVDVVYRARGKRAQISGDYCLNCIPMHILNGIDHNFPADYSGAFTAIGRGKLFKLGLQAGERFWEREQIYGGISWTAQDITQIWYPAHGIHRQKGVLLAAYTFGGDASDNFASLGPAERIERAIGQGEKVHPNYRQYIECGISVAWHQMNHMLGCAAEWNEALYQQWFARLQAPVGNHYLIGDQVSRHAGWQEGAIHSALHAIEDIDRREQAARGGALA